MDIPRQRPKPTWRDSAWWQATRQSLISGVMMMVLALPIIGWLASQVVGLSHQHFETRSILTELLEGELLMMPYLWAYFFALERIARQKKNDWPSVLHQP